MTTDSPAFLFFILFCFLVSPTDKEGKEREKEKQQHQQQQAQLAVPRLSVSADEKIDKAKLAQTEVSPSRPFNKNCERNFSAWDRHALLAHPLATWTWW